MEKLDKLVSEYGEKHYEELALKKVCGEMNTEIKQIMEEDNLDAYTSGEYTVKRSVSVSESMNEEEMLKVLKADWTARYGSMECPYIKTKEYVDMDILESVMYAGELSEETIVALDKCRITKETVKLTLSKSKKSKKED